MARIALPMPQGRVASPTRPRGAQSPPLARPASPPRSPSPPRPAEPAHSNSVGLRGRRAVVTRHALGWIAVSLLFAGVLLSLYLIQVSTVTLTGYDLERLELERQTWLARNQQLEVELAKRRSLAWAELQATQQLGMTRSERPIFLSVHPSSDQREAASATAARSDDIQRSARERPTPQQAATPLDAVRAWLSTLQASRR